MVLGYKWGHKTWYYMNTADGAGEINVAKIIADTPAQDPVDDSNCDSCVL